MHSITEDLSRTPLWTRALEAKYHPEKSQQPFPLTRQDWDEILYDCQAVTDLPAAFFGPELAAAYPEAKVVILNRDPDAWYGSVKETFGQMQKWSLFQIGKLMICSIIDPDTKNFVKLSRTMRTLAVGFNFAEDEKRARKWFAERYKEFRDGVEKERRLEYQVKEGWGPLCEFLGVPVPMVEDETGKVVERPFPRVNDRDMFMAKYRSMIGGCVERAKKNFFLAIGKFSVFGLVVYLVYLALIVSHRS
jgi:hypothetical protein